MPTYKNISCDDINLLYDAVKAQIDGFPPDGEGIPISDVKIMVDEYLAGQVDKNELLSAIKTN